MNGIELNTKYQVASQAISANIISQNICFNYIHVYSGLAKKLVQVSHNILMENSE